MSNTSLVKEVKNMIYPKDVYSRTKKSSGMSAGDKAKIVMAGLLVCNVIFSFMSYTFFKMLGVPFVIVVVLQIILYLFICAQIFRFTVFREQDRSDGESDMFAPYYKLRSGSERVETSVENYDVFELEDGSFVTGIMLTYGMNNKAKAVRTEAFYNRIQDIIFENRLSCRFVVMDEDFVQSKEAHHLLAKANAIEDARLRNTQLMIYNEVLNFTERAGSVPCVYLLISAKGNFLKDNLEDAMVQIFSRFKTLREDIALRDLIALDHSALLQMFQRFYGMDAIDLSLSRVQQSMTQSDILQSITLYKIISTDKKIFTNNIFDKVGTSVKFFS